MDFLFPSIRLNRKNPGMSGMPSIHTGKTLESVPGIPGINPGILPKTAHH